MGKLKDHLTEDRMKGLFIRSDQMNKDEYELLRSSYYDISDNLPNLIKMLGVVGDEAKSELKLWKQIEKLANKSDLGKTL